MSDIEDFFMSHARLSRAAIARFAELDVRDVNGAADDLGFGDLLRLDEAEEVLSELDEQDRAPANAGVQDDEDDDTPDEDDDSPEEETE